MQNIIRCNLKSYQDCQCKKHQNGKLVTAVLKNEATFIYYILCPQVEHPELSRRKKDLHTGEVHKKVEEINTLAAVAKVDAMQTELGRSLRQTEKRTLDDTRNQIDTNKAIQHEIIKIHNRACCYSKCGEEDCGVNNMLHCNICPLESKKNEVSYRRYETGDKLTGSGKRFKNKVRNV